MEYQLQLQVLGNNVECIEKNIKMLVQQFITMQDFIKQEFGEVFSKL